MRMRNALECVVLNTGLLKEVELALERRGQNFSPKLEKFCLFSALDLDLLKMITAEGFYPQSKLIILTQSLGCKYALIKGPGQKVSLKFKRLN